MLQPLVAFGYCATQFLVNDDDPVQERNRKIWYTDQYPFTVSGDIFCSTTSEHSPMLPPDTRLSISNSAMLFKKLQHHSLFIQCVLKDASRGRRTSVSLSSTEEPDWGRSRSYDRIHQPRDEHRTQQAQYPATWHHRSRRSCVVVVTVRTLEWSTYLTDVQME